MAKHKLSPSDLKALGDFVEGRRSDLPGAPAGSPLDTGGIGLATEDAEAFSITRLIRAQVEDTPQAMREAGFEFEVCGAAAERYDAGDGALAIPPEVSGFGLVRAANEATEPSAGGFLVDKKQLGTSMEGLARERSAVMRLAETVPGLIGEVELPRIVDGATAEFLGEDDEAPEVETEYGLLTLRPKTVGCHLEMTRRFVKDAVPGTEAMIRRDLAQALASAMDYSFLTGQGGRHHPIGLLNWTGIGAVTGGTDGAAPAFEHLVALESELAAANLDAGRLAYLTNSDVRGKLKRTPQHATANVGGWCWEAYPGQADPTVGMVNGYPAHVSNLVPSNLDKGSSTGVCSAIIFADWAKVVVGLFGALRLIVDPYSGSKRGRVRLVAFLDADMVVRQAGAVAAMQDVLTVG